ncbi:MAG: hypothetical protein R3B99_32825 [Polyangiales bacterium]
MSVDFARARLRGTVTCAGGVCQECATFACSSSTVGTLRGRRACDGDEVRDGAVPASRAHRRPATTRTRARPTRAFRLRLREHDDHLRGRRQPRTVPVCDMATGCGFANVADGTSCDDADACTTATCTAGILRYGMAVTCMDDGDACTAERCDSALGCVRDTVGDGGACDDGNPCTMAAPARWARARRRGRDLHRRRQPVHRGSLRPGHGLRRDQRRRRHRVRRRERCTTGTSRSAGTCGGGSA